MACLEGKPVFWCPHIYLTPVLISKLILDPGVEEEKSRLTEYTFAWSHLLD